MKVLTFDHCLKKSNVYVHVASWLPCSLEHSHLWISCNIGSQVACISLRPRYAALHFSSTTALAISFFLIYLFFFTNRRTVPWHEAPTIAGFEEGQMYAVLSLLAKRQFPYFKPMTSQS